MTEAQDQLKAGMLWLGSATLLARLLDLGATLVVLTLLTPEEMGLAALALSVGAVLESLSGAGLGDALVQSPTVSERQKSSLFWLATGIGALLAAGMALAAPACRAFYDEPALEPLIQVSALKLVLLGPTVIPLAWLNKNLRFREVGASQTLATAGDGLTRILFAAAGTGAWALIAGNVCRAVVLLTALRVFSRFRPRLHFNWRETQRFASFGLRLSGAGIFNQMHRNIDYFLVGRFLGTEAVGVYRVAFDVAMQPTEAVIALINRAAFPVYARVAGDVQALGAMFLRSTRALVLIAIPAASLIFFATHDILQALAQDRWASSVPAVRLLVWAGLLRAATLVFRQVHVAAGRPHYATVDAAVGLIALTLAIYGGLSFYPELGVLSVCLAWLAVYALLLMAHLGVSRRLLEVRPFDYARALAPGLSTGLVMVTGLMFTEWQLDRTQLGSLPSLLVLAMVGLALYAAYLRLVLKVNLRSILPARSNDPPQT